MSVLASLARAYDRLPDAPPYGFSTEKIGFCVLLGLDGSLRDIIDLRDSDKKRTPRSMGVPASPKRSGSMPRPNFLWDNINYALGAGKISNPDDRRFDAFRNKHLEYLETVKSDELVAFCRFLTVWNPDQLTPHFDIEKLPQEGVIFGLETTYRDRFIHQVNEAREIWASQGDRWKAVAGKNAANAICLVTGQSSSIARTHPAIKGVWNAQPAGAALVSFNSDAYESYGHKQGDNASISEAAAFAYTTVLNHFLPKDSGHSIQIGDASTVFWADGSAVAAEHLFFGAFGGGDTAGKDEKATREIKTRLEMIQQGTALAQVVPDLDPSVRFHVLGLAPNAARLSVRFHYEDDFGTLIANYQNHIANLSLDPPPRDGFPPLWRYLLELAVLGKRENVPPNLAGDWMRAILTGQKYPLTLLTSTLMRLRGDGDVNALRASILKSVLIRNLKLEVPVALDPTSQNKGYVLGRLFAVYEEVQRAALGGKVNATIKDKFYGAASATPQKVFPVLDRGSANHFAKLRKQSPGRAVNLEKLLTAIMEVMEPEQEPIPVALTSAEQAMFGIGYYHQRAEAFRKRETDNDTVEIIQ
ncbi:type I-C CRISPR-associated protein Cas8c/Csd1 [Falsihalocynthiibacter arcticus]|uniref:Type I-C CRISPR-associated protein Cas8c/Csd1 n=1 Tax=Falsihalocynthiibacter arcticus TaxID=1579316 RepID=A0A126V222_9RHOB|nr:type I-C CRISPR-associated protein Cas8c/Csd1 [Falsihalocynthiibacter arcticus]AML51936.1 type I-C CRISPR-associated protein Cas8c/Csd1 [Falsihalocynthiibacter arcticus]